MPSTPTTKSQVQAYRFVLRRMESALARKDPVMLHEPMRTHQRSLAAGAVLAICAVLGFLVVGLISPTGKVPGAGGIVIGRDSGAIYVVAGDPPHLIPVPNIASAKLLLMSQGMTPAEPTAVAESALQSLPKGPLTGIPGAPEMLPTGEDQKASPYWGVCDRLSFDPGLPREDAERQAMVETAVLVGVEDLGQALPKERALLVESVDKETYLVYRNDQRSERPVVRARIDLENSAVTAALGLDSIVPRRISTGLLNAIPEGDPLDPPRIANRDEAPDFEVPTSRVRVGRVLRVERAEGYEFYVVLRSGKQLIPTAVAELIRYDVEGTGNTDFVDLRPNEVSEIPDAKPEDRIELEDYPSAVPKLVGVRDNPVTCLSWNTKDNRIFTNVTFGDRLPLPEGMQPVKLAGYQTENMENLDLFFMPPGRGAVVQGVTTQVDLMAGPLYLVSDRGVKYGIPDSQVAKGLGLGEHYQAAPQNILNLLPNGSPLDPKLATKIYDTLPVDPDAPKAELPETPDEGQSGSDSDN